MNHISAGQEAHNQDLMTVLGLFFEQVMKVIAFRSPKMGDGKSLGSLLVSSGPASFWARIIRNKNGQVQALLPSVKTETAWIRTLKFLTPQYPSLGLWSVDLHDWVAAGLAALYRRHIQSAADYAEASPWQRCDRCALCHALSASDTHGLGRASISEKRDGIVRSSMLCLMKVQFIDTGLSRMLSLADVTDNGLPGDDVSVRLRIDGRIITRERLIKEEMENAASDCRFFIPVREDEHAPAIPVTNDRIALINDDGFSVASPRYAEGAVLLPAKIKLLWRVN